MLKKLSLFLLTVMLLASCGTLTRERQTLVSFASFSDYPDMWISPNDCPMAHEVLGQLVVEIIPAIEGGQRAKIGDGIYTKTPSQKGLTIEHIPYDEILATVVAEARARGANGISNLSITGETTIKVSGVLIRRL